MKQQYDFSKGKRAGLPRPDGTARQDPYHHRLDEDLVAHFLQQAEQNGRFDR